MGISLAIVLIQGLISGEAEVWEVVVAILVLGPIAYGLIVQPDSDR